MGEPQYHILLGIHNPFFAAQIKMRFEFSGHRVDLATTVEEMLMQMGIAPDDAPEVPPTIPHQIYLMDLNLGSPNAPSCDSAQRIYAHVRGEVETGRVKFLGISGNEIAQEMATAHAIPNTDTLELHGAIGGLLE